MTVAANPTRPNHLILTSTFHALMDGHKQVPTHLQPAHKCTADK